MKLTCQSGILAQALEIFADSKNSDVLLSATKSGLRLTQTAREMTVSVSVRANVEEHGAVVVPTDMLCNLVNSVFVGSILDISDMAKDEDDSHSGALQVEWTNGKTLIKGESLNKFPNYPVTQDATATAPLTLTHYIGSDEMTDKIDVGSMIDCNTVRQISQLVAIATAPHADNRMALRGIKVEATARGVRFVGADGFRLAALDTRLFGPALPEGTQFIFPLPALQAVTRICGSTNGLVEMLYSTISKHVLFRVNSAEVITNSIDADYPSYENLMPAELPTKVTVLSHTLTDAIRGAGKYAPNADYAVRFSAQETDKEGQGVLEVRSESHDKGYYEARTTVEVEGAPGDTILNATYIAPVLAALPEGITLEIPAEAIKPCVIRPAYRDNYYYLVMPIMRPF